MEYFVELFGIYYFWLYGLCIVLKHPGLYLQGLYICHAPHLPPINPWPFIFPWPPKASQTFQASQNFKYSWPQMYQRPPKHISPRSPRPLRPPKPQSIAASHAFQIFKFLDLQIIPPANIMAHSKHTHTVSSSAYLLSPGVKCSIARLLYIARLDNRMAGVGANPDKIITIW